MPAEIKPYWPFNREINLDIASQTAASVHDQDASWRQAITHALLTETQRSITSNQRHHVEIEDPQYRALYGYKASLEALLVFDGILAVSTIPESINKELLDDVRPEGKPLTSMAHRDADETWDANTGIAGITALKDIIIDSLEYHLTKIGNIDRNIRHRALIYMHGAEDPQLPNDLLNLIDRPTLIGRLQGARGYEMLRKSMLNTGLLAEATSHTQ